MDARCGHVILFNGTLFTLYLEYSMDANFKDLCCTHAVICQYLAGCVLLCDLLKFKVVFVTLNCVL